MFSWFPIFFPLKMPVYLSTGSSVELHFWRMCDARKVWYEWTAVPILPASVSTPETALVGGASTIHNVGGRSYWIGL
ncbi:hypothetical protein SpCBS45565_g01045 [Spizellomyces sp. 'palustris']|nr:hypothetical protein SpCBS45565_g01045 [Spizellomyces sp. 'palustris']